MARPKRPKTELVQTNPKYEEYGRKLTDKFLADTERYKPMQERWLKGYNNLSEEAKIKLGLLIPKECEPSYKEKPIIVFSKLTDTQLESLLPLLNDYCAKKPLSVERLKDIFNLKINGLLIKNAKFLAYIFYQLSERNLIIDSWQDILRENKTFVSKNGKPINLSSELSNFLVDINGDGLNGEGKLKPTHNRNKRIAKHIQQIIDTLCS